MALRHVIRHYYYAIDYVTLPLRHYAIGYDAGVATAARYGAAYAIDITIDGHTPARD